MKILKTTIEVDLLKEAEAAINNRYRIMIGDSQNGTTEVWYNDPADLLLFGQALGVIRATNRFEEELKKRGIDLK